MMGMALLLYGSRSRRSSSRRFLVAAGRHVFAGIAMGIMLESAIEGAFKLSIDSTAAKPEAAVEDAISKNGGFS